MEDKGDKKKMNKKITFMAMPIAIAITVGTLAFATNLFGIYNPAKQTEASIDASCLPSTLSVAAPSIPVKEPTSLPTGFSLKAVDTPGGAVVLYYADHSLCPFTGSLTDHIENGTLVIVVSQPGDISNGTDFQQREIAYYQNSNETIAKVQPIEVAGHKGVGWEPFQAEDQIIIDGKVVQSTPIQKGGMVRFFDDNDKTIYTITAIQPLSKLLEVAASIK